MRKTVIECRCDNCGRIIGGTYGPLSYEWSSQTEPQINRKGEVCTADCLLRLVAKTFSLLSSGEMPRDLCNATFVSVGKPDTSGWPSMVDVTVKEPE